MQLGQGREVKNSVSETDIAIFNIKEKYENPLSALKFVMVKVLIISNTLQNMKHLSIKFSNKLKGQCYKVKL